MLSLFNTLFSRFFHRSDKQSDPNKDINGKGTLERYNQIIAKDIDENITPFIENIFDNLVVPFLMLDKYIPDREQSLGNDYLFLSFDPMMRKRIIKHWHRYVAIRGTIPGYQVLFAMLGITAVITEVWDTGGFDSATEFDSDIRPTFDNGRCQPCSPYTIDLTGPTITPELYQAIWSIIQFNEPINADLESITYNSVPLFPLVANWFYETDIIGVHQPIFTNVGPTLFFDFTGAQNWVSSNNPSYNYLTGGVKQVDVVVGDFGLVTGINMTAQKIVNSLDLSLFIGLTQYQFNNNPDLLAITFPLSSTALIEKMYVEGSGCSILDMSGLENLGGEIFLSGAALLTWSLWGGGKSTSATTILSLTNSGVNHSIDLEALLFDNGANVSIVDNADITGITFGTTIQLNNLDNVILSNNDSCTSIDIDAMRGEILVFDCSDNGALTTLNIGSGWGDRPSETKFLGMKNVSLNTLLDVSTMPIADVFDVTDSAITSVSHTTSFGAINKYSINTCPNISYYDISVCQGILGANNAIFDAADCGLSASDVDSFLFDLVKICITLRMEINPGTYTGRTVEIAGSNAAPTALGLGYIAQLNNIGISVTHN